MTLTEYPTATQEDIETLISYFNILYNEEHPHKYTISELYTNNTGTLPLQCYELKNITMELEKGILIASDKDEILWNEKHHLHTIIAEHIDYITFHSCTDAVTLTICKDGVYRLVIKIGY